MFYTLAGRTDMGEKMFSVYRLFDARGALAYVGVTKDLGQRLAMHRLQSEWWPEIDPDLTAVTYHPTAREAGAEEWTLISEHQPRLNVNGTLSPYTPYGRDYNPDRIQGIPDVEWLRGELRAERARSQITYEELAAIADVPRSTAHGCIGGSRDFNIPAFFRLATALGLNPLDLIHRSMSVEGRRTCYEVGC